MVTKDTVNAEIDKIYTMHKESDRFNAVSWELSCLKNLIKEL